MHDLRLYEPSGNFENVARASEQMRRVLPDDPRAKGIEVIAGKVVKFMLTEKGSDAFNQDYGTTSMHYLQMSQIFLPQFRREVLTDVARCQEFIKKADAEISTKTERLDHIEVLRIDYDPQRSPWRVDVYLDVYTTFGNHAVVALNPTLTNG